MTTTPTAAAAAAKPILHGFDLSPPVRAVLLTLKALNIDYDYKEVNTLKGEQQDPEYIKKNPQHTVPTLEDDGKTIWDSHAIIAYLSRKYGKDDSIYPKGFYQRAVVDQRLHYENGVIFMSVMKEKLSPIFRSPDPATPEQIAAVKTAIQEVYTLLETYVAEQPFMAADRVTIADFSIVSTVSTLAVAVPIDAAKYPKLRAWADRMKELPYYEEANGKGLKAMTEFMQSKLDQFKDEPKE